jgi:hypothetical protein
VNCRRPSRVVTLDSIFQIASGFMAAKHLFVANEIGLFTSLADGRATLECRPKLAEGDSNSTASWHFDAEFVMATAQVLEERVAIDHDRRTSPAFESSHPPQPSLEPPVAGLDRIVGTSLHDVADLRHALVERSGIHRALSVVTSAGRAE